MKDDSTIFVIQGKKEDYTDEAIRAVFEFMNNTKKMNQMKDTRLNLQIVIMF